MAGKRFPQSQQDALCGLLREIRTEARLSQVQLAERLKQPQSYVSKYESGERRLDPLEVWELCRAVGITFSRFGERLDALLTGKRRSGG